MSTELKMLGRLLVFLLVFSAIFCISEFLKRTPVLRAMIAARQSSTKRPSALLPIMDPIFNVREMACESILLEKHLNSPERRCHDCIKKHFLGLEALAEEAIGLDKAGQYLHVLMPIPSEIRRLQQSYINQVDPCIIAQQLRELRKPWMYVSFDMLGKASGVGPAAPGPAVPGMGEPMVGESCTACA